MPSLSVNFVLLAGTLASDAEPVTLDRVRAVRLRLATEHAGGARVHRVLVADEYLAREASALVAGARVSVTGEVDYDAEGMLALVAPRQGCDLAILDAGAGVSLGATPGARPRVPLASAPAARPAAPPAPAPALGMAAGLAALAGLGDSPDEEDGHPDEMRAPATPGPARVEAPRPAATAPVPTAASTAAPAPRTVTPRMLPGARPPAPAPRPVPSPHAISQPRPTDPPLRPPTQALRKDAFAAQVDDADIPF